MDQILKPIFPSWVDCCQSWVSACFFGHEWTKIKIWVSEKQLTPQASSHSREDWQIDSDERGNPTQLFHGVVEKSNGRKKLRLWSQPSGPWGQAGGRREKIYFMLCIDRSVYIDSYRRNSFCFGHIFATVTLDCTSTVFRIYLTYVRNSQKNSQSRHTSYILWNTLREPIIVVCSNFYKYW